MSDNILKTFNKDNAPSLQFTTEIAQTVNNDTGEKLSTIMEIDVDDPLNMNSRSTLVNDDIPFVQLNNTLDQEEDPLSFPDVTGELVATEEELNATIASRQLQAKFEKNMVVRTKTRVNEITKGGDIAIIVKKPVGFNSAVKETINRKGIFRLYDENGLLVYSKDNIINNLYNIDIINYMLSDEARAATGIHKLNVDNLKQGNNIPVSVIGNTFSALEKYNLNTFMLSVPITKKDNILRKLLKSPDSSKMQSRVNLTYELNFSIFLDIEITDTFPVEFIWTDGASDYSANNKLLTSKSNHSVKITNVSSTSTFYQDCMDAEYRNLYLIFK